MQCKGEGSPNGRKRKRKNDYRAGGGGAGRFQNNGVPRTFRKRAHQRENPRQGVRLYGHARTEPVSAQKDPKVRTNNIAMVVPQRFITLDLPFLRKCMGGICTMADQRGYDMLLCYASSTEYTQLQRQLASHKVDGVILTYAMADDPCVDLLRQYDVPFVLIGRSEDKTIPQADNDQVTAACEMTRILLQMGAKRIALLVGVNPHSANVGVAMMLADYITNEDNQAKRFNDRQLGPSNIAVNESEAVQSAPAIAALAEQSDYATLQRVGANYWSSAESLGEILASGDTQGKTTQQLVDDAVAGITAPVTQ